MGKMAKRAKLLLTPDVFEKLSRIARSRTESLSAVRRANILLMYSQKKRIAEMAQSLETNRPLIERTIDKALAFGPLQALKDLARPGAPKRIPQEARNWVLSIACQKPTDFGYAHETWTYDLLVKHIREHCHNQGHATLAKLSKSRLHAILNEGEIKPHKIKYYITRRDPDFDKKMANVLCVYREVELQKTSKSDLSTVTISYDEKPGIQAIGNIVADLLPKINEHSTIARDPEYKRLGTVSLLAGIDLHTGRVIPLVRDRHRSREFIEFLEKLDKEYPNNVNIRLILDNHSAHKSKETQRYLKSKPNRFTFVFTPTHGSWLNLIEAFFSKISRSFLRHIRVHSKQELMERIYRGIEQINQEPVIYKWQYKISEISL